MIKNDLRSTHFVPSLRRLSDHVHLWALFGNLSASSNVRIAPKAAILKIEQGRPTDGNPSDGVMV